MTTNGLEKGRTLGIFSSRQSGVVLLLLLAFWLRLLFLLGSGLYVDEYITVLAARAVERFGYPRLPSGLFYNHGLPFVYIDAVLFILLGSSKVVARFPALLFGLLTVALVYRAGQHWFSPRVGLYASAVLATTTTAIIWGGRARMYTLQQFCFLLAVVGLVEGLRRDDRRYRLVGVLAALLAILTHPLTLAFLFVFVLSGLLIVTLVYRVRLQIPVRLRSLWPEGGLIVLGGAILLALRFIRGPWSISGRTQTDLGVLSDPGYLIPHLLGGFHPFIIFPDLVLTVLFVTGLLSLALRLVRRQLHPGDGLLSLLYLTFLGGVVGVASFLVFQADRYVLALTPLYCLAVGRELSFLTERLEILVRRPIAVRGLSWVGLMLLMLPPAVDVAASNPIPLDCAWSYVRDHWQEGDAVATGMPVVAYGWLDRVDYFAMEIGHKTFEIDGRRVDIWTGASLIDSPQEMQAALDRHRRLWFVMDERGWDWFYSPAFQELVEREMHPVSDCPGMRVYVSGD